ncbi:hypothetical protein BGZ58_003021 [Dissophora ornata]|nr:hypothetical protein BGZ58_003021 [Dissophora ornata]
MFANRKRKHDARNARTREAAAILSATAAAESEVLQDSEEAVQNSDDVQNNKSGVAGDDNDDDNDDDADGDLADMTLDNDDDQSTPAESESEAVAKAFKEIMKEEGEEEEEEEGSCNSNNSGQKKRKLENTNDTNGFQELSKIERKQLKKEAKKQAKKSEGNGGKPCFMLSRSHNKLSIKDLRDLVVYLLTETKTLPWIMVKNKFNIHKVVLLYVPGLDPQLFNIDLKDPESSKPVAWVQKVVEGPATEFHHLKMYFDVMNVMKAGGDKHRVHPPPDTLLNVPLSNTEKQKREEEMKSKKKAAMNHKPEAFMLKVEELRESDYPLPTYLDLGTKLQEYWIETPQKISTLPVPKKMIAMDCEMVRTTAGSEVTRVSLVDDEGAVIYDELVVPDNDVVDYLTQYSGMTEERLRGVTTKLVDVQKRLQELVTYDTILVGHSLENDMKVLKRRIQAGGESGHDSIEDAQACMDLVKLKIKEGPGFGEYNRDQESIFSRILRHTAPRTSVVIDNETFSGKAAATKIIETKTDAEVVKAIPEAIQDHNFVWARLRAMEINHGRTPRFAGPAAADAEERLLADADSTSTMISNPSEGGTTMKEEEQIREAVKSIDKSVSEIIESLPSNTAVIVTSGQGDLREMLKMQARQRNYQKLYNTTNLSAIPREDQFLEEDQKLLEEAVDRAKNGVCFFMVK